MKQKHYFFLFILISLIILYNCSENEVIDAHKTSILPLPKSIKHDEGVLELKNGFYIKAGDNDLQNLQTVLNDFQALTDIITDHSIPIIPEIDKTYATEYYQLKIETNSVSITGGSYRALVYGLTSLIQLSIDKTALQTGIISDQPDYAYRGLMLDLSRNWHDISTLKQMIVLASYYKINYLQLHLTDDALFTFQSKAFPKLASQQSYSSEDLKQLNEFAYKRGVTLIPEIDVPGHSSGFIRTMPELFGLANVSSNSYTLNMGKEAVYEALEVLFAEVAEAFPYSPYIHLGGDEVFTSGFETDADVQAYLKSHDLENVEALYRHFLGRVVNMIKKQGKQAMLWSGFEREGIEIPKDVIIMNWNPGAYASAQMIEDGYQVINASWKPLYLVNNRKWSPETIYNWNVTDWKGFQTPDDAPALQAPKHESLLGGSIAMWEQNQFKAYQSLKERLPAMAERLWDTTAINYLNFKDRVEVTDSKLEEVLFPFKLEENGLMFPKNLEPNFREDMWFQEELKLSLIPNSNDLELRYTLDGSAPTLSSPLYSETVSITKRSRFSVQAFKNEKAIGQTLLKDYQLMPVSFQIDGLYNNLQSNSWERHKFLDAMQVTLHSKLDGTIHYTTDNSSPTIESPIYREPFIMKHSRLLRAKLFDGTGQQIGSERREEYEQLQLETSLTTGKKVTTSNAYESGIPSLVTNGEISRWDHWGAHTDGNNWVIIDLEKEETIKAFKVYTFWDNYRYYEYTISVSNDAKNWTMVVDQSKNRKLSVPEGQLDAITPTKAHYLKLQLIRNSANPGLHVVEFQAF